MRGIINYDERDPAVIARLPADLMRKSTPISIGTTGTVLIILPEREARWPWSGREPFRSRKRKCSTPRSAVIGLEARQEVAGIIRLPLPR